MGNLIVFKIKQIEKCYKDFYRNGAIDLTLDEVNRYYIHNTTTTRTYQKAYIRLLNNKIS